MKVKKEIFKKRLSVEGIKILEEIGNPVEAVKDTQIFKDILVALVKLYLNYFSNPNMREVN